MIKWQQYVESVEKDEEKSGIDLDHDNEKGESKEHIKKFKDKKAEMIDFFTKRKEGAAKIAAAAKEKGGVSTLTYWHFRVKNKEYLDVISAIKSDKDEKYFIGKYKEILSSINVEKMKQKEIQEAMGRLEIWSEAVSELFVS